MEAKILGQDCRGWSYKPGATNPKEYLNCLGPNFVDSDPVVWVPHIIMAAKVGDSHQGIQKKTRSSGTGGR